MSLTTAKHQSQDLGRWIKLFIRLTHYRLWHRRYASGLWRHGSMTGYTTTGIGVSGLPVRFNTRGEVVLITLRCC